MDIKYNGEPAAEPKLGTLHRHRTVDVKDDDYIRLGAVADSSSVELLVRSDKDDSDSVSSHSSGKAGEEETKWHLLPPSEVLSILNTSSSGLSTDDANQRLKKCGPNIYDESELLDKFHNKSLLKFTNGIQVMLALSGTLSYINYFVLSNFAGPESVGDFQKIVLGTILFAVVILTALMQKHQEKKTERIFTALNQLVPVMANVLRDGALHTLDASSIVPGDIVKIGAGERVPADIRVLESYELQVNKKTITGESASQAIGLAPLNVKLHSASNILLCGCFINSGHAVGVVYATGRQTYLYSVNEKTATTTVNSSLTNEVSMLIRYVSVASIFIGIPFFVLALQGGYSYQAAISLLIGVIISNIPIALLPQISVSFSGVARKLLHRNIFVSRLDIMDTMGCVDVFLMDKTGTVTEATMETSYIMCDLKLLPCASLYDAPTDAFRQSVKDCKSFLGLIHCACLSADAEVDCDEGESSNTSYCSVRSQPGVRQDETEKASINFANNFCPVNTYRNEYKRVFSIPFSSVRRFMLIIYSQEASLCDILGRPSTAVDAINASTSTNTRPFLVAIKGAPDTVLRMCDSILHEGSIIPLTRELREKVRSLNVELAQSGKRVLAFAFLQMSALEFPPEFAFAFNAQGSNFPLNGFIFTGFFAFTEKVRVGIDNTISSLKQAGIRSFLVTGDHPLNAQSIAHKAKIITRPSRSALIASGITVASDFKGSACVTGSQISDFLEEQWDELLECSEIVFSQMLPHQKEEVVVRLRRKGLIVGMIGDGVNDGPALKHADVSVSMGSGVQLAKDSAHIILLDNDFRGLLLVVEEGRRLKANMSKTIQYIMSSNMPELVPFLVFSTYRSPNAITPVTMLIFEVLLNVAPAICFSYEESEGRIMQQPADHGSIITVTNLSYCYFLGLMLTSAAYSAYLNTFMHYGFSIESLGHAGPHFRDAYSILSDERQQFFSDMCTSNPQFLAAFPSDSADQCDNDAFQKFRVHVLNKAQGAYLLILVLGQAGNALALRTSSISLFSPTRLLSNTRMWLSLLGGALVAVLIVYNNTVNIAFLFEPPETSAAVIGLWIFPVIILWEEARKWVMYRRKAELLE